MPRREPIVSKSSHERWLVSYSDFITLLFAFFVVMYSVSQVNEGKYKTLSATLEAAFTASGGMNADGETLPETTEKEPATLATIASELNAALEGDLPQPDGGQLSIGELYFSGDEQWLEMSLPSSLLFSSGEADLRRSAREILATVTEVMAKHDNAISVEGHTDSQPISNERFPNNWALSSARAVAVVDFLAFQGVAPTRLAATGFGEFRPIADNTTEEGREKNRRVVIKISAKSPDLPGSTLAPDSSATEVPPDNLLKKDSETLAPSSTPTEEAPEPVRLQGGGLLFTSDPDLPRNNPPVEEPVPTPSVEPQ